MMAPDVKRDWTPGPDERGVSNRLGPGHKRIIPPAQGAIKHQSFFIWGSGEEWLRLPGQILPSRREKTTMSIGG